ncbi:MAG: glycosyl transferase family 4 [Desulfurococcaceae archaeon]
MYDELIKVLVPALVSIVTANSMINWWINTGRRLGYVSRDMNKPGDHYVVESGGIWVILSITFGMLTYIAMDIYLEKDMDTLPLLTISMTLLLAGLLGFLDDILGWKKGISPGKRVLFTIPIAIPLMVIKAGYSVIEIPFIGPIDLGLLYPLLVVPIGVMGASNAFNMIAGYNGLEAMQGILITFFTLIFSFIKGIHSVVPPLVIALSTLLVFYNYNKYPARVFPGNSLTYGYGAFYASVVIYGNFEKFGLMMFALYFIEFSLFVRGLVNRVYKENFGKVADNGDLMPPYDKVYSLTHLAIKMNILIKGNCREIDVVKVIAILQVMTGLMAVLLNL